MKFHVADALTGDSRGRIEPIRWDYTDPLTGFATGSVALDPADPKLAHLTRLRSQILLEDEDGRITGGPVHQPPARGEDGLVQVPFVDWRGWWYRALLWPNADESRRDYFATDTEQMVILDDVAAIGLDHTAAPNMVVDEQPASGVTRTRTYRMFARVGDIFDDIARSERGPDWWTYVARSGAVFIPHTTFRYPQRSLRGLDPVLLSHRLGVGGNVLSVQWPPGQDRANVVYGTGSGTPPDQGWAVAEHQNVTDGGELVWPEVMSLPSGTRSSAAAFEHVLSRLEALAQEDGTVTLSVTPGQPATEDYAPGDLARLVVTDGWRDVDLPTTRILSRTLSGRGDSVHDVTLTLELGFDPADLDDDPGDPETEEA